MSVTNKPQSMTTASGIRITPFGATENPALVRQLPSDGVVCVDTLARLKDLWGANILSSRQHLYRMVSGDVSDEVFSSLLVSYYKRFSAFANYVDEAYLFEDRNLPLVQRIMGPARAAIREYEAQLKHTCNTYCGEYLGNHQDYAYFRFRGEIPPAFKELRVC